MLEYLHAGLRALVYERGLIPAAEVDVRFEMPTREWLSTLTRPTISFFLFDVVENADLRHSSPQMLRGQGFAERRMPPRRFDLRYMVSAFASEVEDEHLLYWRTMVTLLQHPHLPPEILPEPLRDADPPLSAGVERAPEGPRILDLWGGLELPPRPALLYHVTTSVDLEFSVRLPLVLTRTTRYVRAFGEPVSEEGFLIGGIVRDGKGAALAGVKVSVEGSALSSLTDGEGRFSVVGIRAGTVVLLAARDGEPPRRISLQVPSDSYEIVLE